jgi:hypothetical protein
MIPFLITSGILIIRYLFVFSKCCTSKGDSSIDVASFGDMSGSLMPFNVLRLDIISTR